MHTKALETHQTGTTRYRSSQVRWFLIVSLFGLSAVAFFDTRDIEEVWTALSGGTNIAFGETNCAARHRG